MNPRAFCAEVVKKESHKMPKDDNHNAAHDDDDDGDVNVFVS